MDASTIRRLNAVTVELSTRCNSRCVYCSNQGLAPDQRFDLSFPLYAHLLAGVRELKAASINFSGYGENTMNPHWADMVRLAQEQGLGVAFLSNLARVFSDDELDVLAGVQGLSFSMDSTDPGMYELLRQGCSFSRFVGNLESVIRRAAARGMQQSYTLQAVVSNRTFHGMGDVVKFAHEHGIQNVYFLPCYLKPETRSILCPDKRSLTPLWMLSRQQARELVAAMDESAELADRYSLTVRFMGTFLQEARQALQKHESDGPRTPEVTVVGTGQAIPCILPWSELYVRASGDVFPCCLSVAFLNSWGTLGNERAGTLESIVNCEAARGFRASLLNGAWPERCLMCQHGASFIALDEFRRWIEPFTLSDGQGNEGSFPII